MSDTTVELVKSVVNGLSMELGYESLRTAESETVLFGGLDGIDSLSLVRIVTAVEQAVEEKFSKHLVLADERAMSRRSSPFRTVGSLAELVQERLGE